MVGHDGQEIGVEDHLPIVKVKAAHLKVSRNFRQNLFLVPQIIFTNELLFRIR